MKITSVSFRANLQMKPFHHVTVEATADVEPGELPSMVVEKLKDFVTVELQRALGSEVEGPDPNRFPDKRLQRTSTVRPQHRRDAHR